MGGKEFGLPLSLAWSGDGRRLAVCSKKGFTTVYTFTSEFKFVSSITSEHHSGRGLGWNPVISTELATAGKDGQIWLWDVDSSSKFSKKKIFDAFSQTDIESKPAERSPHEFSSLLWGGKGEEIMVASQWERQLQRFNVELETRKLRPIETLTCERVGGARSRTLHLVKSPEGEEVMATTGAIFSAARLDFWKVDGFAGKEKSENNGFRMNGPMGACCEVEKNFMARRANKFGGC